MKTFKSQTGQLGEDIACEYLVDKKYKIVERNYRQKWGELDIVAKAPDKTLVFMEVKTLYENPNIRPEDNLTKPKLEKLKRTASLYAGHFQNLINDKKGWRIDLIAITLRPGSGQAPQYNSGQVNSQENCAITHYENL
ncbi:MAG: YraN family protein [Spirochaetota bacterium]